ncbi:efflux RND transporter permease subunit [Mogibacterium timidum]|uniref:Membrane protein, MMPL family n=1 Tax=Mogibacterium timidum ATCC 33093 TaxID=1401079 RepID=X8IPQ5_9FIRM|nr:MMPL family transporter [Mogibacterium timidum]EUC51820.1 membrane protein, MMPL family [Mogibacterium timidum ATCC 33093]
MKLGAKVVKHRRIILIAALLLLIPSFIGYKTTRINYDMLTYLPSTMDTMKGQNVLMNEFGKGGFSIVVLEHMKSDDVTKLKADYSRIDGVDQVLNLEDVLDPSIPKSMLPDQVSRNLSNKDASLMVVFFKNSTSDDKTLTAVEEMRKVSSKDTYVSGLSALVQDLKTLCEDEEVKYVAVAVILSLLAMMLLLDSYAAPVIFMISIGMAILYNMGTNIFLGEISYITKAIAAVLQLGVTMDYSIFLWHSYMEKLDSGLDNHEAMGEAIDATLVSVTGSSATTIAGFLALCFMTYTMGKDLGIVMAKGVVFGVISSVTVLPVLLLRFNKTLKRTRHKSLIPDMTKFAHGLTSRYGIYIAIFCILIIPAIYGYNHQNVVYDFTKMLSSGQNELPAEKTQFLTANNKLSEDFGINTSYIIIADAKLSALDGREMSDKIKKVDGVQSVLGLDSVMGTSIPKNMLPDELRNGLMSKKHQMIVVNSKYKVSTTECNKQIDTVKTIAHKYDKSSTVIGEAPATKDLIRLTDKDFKVVNWISIGLVFLIILAVLKSISLPFILVAAIEFAIYVNMGISGFTGLELPFIVPVCISTIQLGSTVDYAILMSTRYKSERLAGLGKRDAVSTAAAASIPSIIVSALGFFTATIGVSIYSNIGIISTLCTMMARGAIISMLTVILVLPSFLMAFDSLVCRTTGGLRDIYEHKSNTNVESNTI